MFMSTEKPRKKISLQDAIKQQLENKKKQTATNRPSNNPYQSTKQMKSQQTKKQNK